MLSQQFQQPVPPNKVSTFMDKAVWPTIAIIVGTPIAAFIGAIWLGSIHILDFNWLMLGLGLIMILLTSCFAWYSHRTRVVLQNKYDNDVTALKREYYAFRQNFTDMVNHEFNRLNIMFTGYTQANATEQNERLEEMKKQLIEKIKDAETGMDSDIKNAQTIFSGAVQSYGIAVDQYSQQLIQAVKRIDALEEQLRKIPSPESQE